jgi:hypothetical protein
VYSSAVREGFIELTKKTVLDNAKVLEEKAKDVLEEAEGLIDDAWKYGEVEDKNMQLYVIGILQPMAYGVYIDLLLGNLPAFFVDLRLLLESLACCYMVKFSLEDPSLGIARPDVSASKILREFGKATSLGKKPNELWGKLSKNGAPERSFEVVFEGSLEEALFKLGRVGGRHFLVVRQSDRAYIEERAAKLGFKGKVLEAEQVVAASQSLSLLSQFKEDLADK